MYDEILRGILFEHASVYRAVTVEEYRDGIVSSVLHEAEYYRLCELYSRVLRSIDPYLMTLTIDIYELLEIMGTLATEYSEWELEEEIEECNKINRDPLLNRP